jgi:HSP20 family molecular chaperone IbpA
MEIDHGPFVRDIELPQPIIEADIHLAHHNGLLWIELPKKPS